MTLGVKTKGFLIVCSCILISVYISSCTRNELDLPKYDNKECYYSDGVGDYIDFSKYYYNSESISDFNNYPKFKMVSQSDIANIKAYFEDFELWVVNQEYYDKYDFNKDIQINEGDFCYIETDDESDTGDPHFDKFHDYKVYYADVESCILYYIYVHY